MPRSTYALITHFSIHSNTPPIATIIYLLTSICISQHRNVKKIKIKIEFWIKKSLLHKNLSFEVLARSAFYIYVLYVITTTLVPILCNIISSLSTAYTVRDGRFLGGNTKRLVWLRSIVRRRTQSQYQWHQHYFPWIHFHENFREIDFTENDSKWVHFFVTFWHWCCCKSTNIFVWDVAIFRTTCF